MDIHAIKAQLVQNFPGDHIEISNEGNHLNVFIVSQTFEGLSPVKKQQKVYAALSENIASGEVHAVNMKLLTPEEH